MSLSARDRQTLITIPLARFIVAQDILNLFSLLAGESRFSGRLEVSYRLKINGTSVFEERIRVQPGALYAITLLREPWEQVFRLRKGRDIIWQIDTSICALATCSFFNNSVAFPRESIVLYVNECNFVYI